MRGLRAIMLLALAWGCQAGSALACRHALVLALDVSGSVDEQEYLQQTLGLSRALQSPEVAALLLADPGSPVHVVVFEWSSTNHQRILVPWTAISDADTLSVVAERIAGVRAARQGLKTAIGTALLFAEELLAERPGCARQTIDISADGVNNAGLLPRVVAGRNGFSGIVVNALVVTSPQRDPEERLALRAYFEAEVIHGPGAFSMIAQGYQDYEDAMRRKLIRELTPMVLGRRAGDLRPFWRSADAL